MYVENWAGSVHPFAFMIAVWSDSLKVKSTFTSVPGDGRGFGDIAAI